MIITITTTWKPKHPNSGFTGMPHIHTYSSFKEALDYVLEAHQYANNLEASILDIQMKVES